MQGNNGLALYGPELELGYYFGNNGRGDPIGASEMAFLYKEINHFMEKGVRQGHANDNLCNQFVDVLRNQWGRYLAYCCVPELQKVWGEVREHTLLNVYHQPSETTRRFLTMIGSELQFRRPLSNPFAKPMWDKIKSLVAAEKGLQWLLWEHDNSSAQPDQHRQLDSHFQHHPALSSARQAPFEADGGARQPQDAQQPRSGPLRGSYADDLAELVAPQPQTHEAVPHREFLLLQDTGVTVDTGTGSKPSKHYSARMADLEEQVKALLLMIEKGRSSQGQDEARPEDTSTVAIAPGDIGGPHGQRHAQGGSTRPGRAPPQDPGSKLGGIAKHTGHFEMSWIPRTDTGSTQGTTATQGPRPTSAWGPEPARTSRPEYDPTISRQGGFTGRGGAFNQAAGTGQQAGVHQGRRTQDTRPLPPQDGRYYEPQAAQRGDVQGLGITFGDRGRGTGRARGGARGGVGLEGSMFQPPGSERGNQSAGQATGGLWVAAEPTAGQWEGHQDEEEDVKW
ncbi:hypothetical protein MMC18_002507 [Xylographa bjoerkii]|nr:hypothetical protein [Xylographa bjoerkii]